MILGADTDELREVQSETQKFAQKVDQVIMALTILVAILKAASIWTGGSSLKFALYLEKTVIPWLRIISSSAKAFAAIVGANAQAQDEVSAGHTVDFGTLPRYESPQLPSSSTADFPVLTAPSTPTGGNTLPGHGGTAGVDGGTPVASGGASGPAPAGPTYSGGSGGTIGSTGPAGGSLPSSGGTGTYSGGDGSPALGSSGSGSGSGSSGGSVGTGSAGTAGDALGDPTGSAAGALGAGTASGGGTAGGTSTYGGDPSSYDGPGGLGTTPAVTEGDGSSNAGTYAAAGTAGALGVGGAAALAGRGLGGGDGFTSPNGFDYHRIQGVKDNPNVTPEFLRRTEQIAAKLGCPPEHLMAVMSFETGGSFSAAQKNMAGGSATGLIQFMPATARGLGTTTAELARMTPVQQLDYVEKYFGNGRYTTVEGLYSKVLAGRAVNDPGGVLFREGTAAHRANRGVDINRDGLITAGEAAAKVRARILPGG
ncbi:MAG: hypothetical protein ACRCSN_19455 [Dermatophilaceae bacterium]